MAMQDTLEQLQNFDINDLDINNIGSWPGPVKVIIMVLALLLVLGAGYYFYLTDKQTMLERAEAKEVELKADYEVKAEKAANLEEYRAQKQQMEATFGALLKQLPQDTEVPGLLDDITRTALDNELTIESIDLQAERQLEFYVELPIDIVVEGQYHKIGTFVSGVAALSRIVTLHDFTLEPQGSPLNLKLKILAKTYRYLDGEE
ncbi:MAG: pilus assembly protein PilP [Gammaproteobacteria bacterium]|jgi:type IV pilus assembly protein PilO|nr:MAG: pilus assembly protein PilP [Gammaproteobacteria bacterium]